MKFADESSKFVNRLSPTSFEVMLGCRRRFALGQHGAHLAGGTDATRLGSICHAVLDKAVAGHALALADWRSCVETLWADAVAVEEARASEAGIDKPARTWSGYEIKRARLLKVAERLRTFLADIPVDTQLLTEHPMSAEGGRLFGRADLILRGPHTHRIIDYKSGAVTEDDGTPRRAYVHQLQVYALLEHADSGSWPGTAHLFPLHGPPVEIDVEPEECIRRGREAIQLLDAFNAVAPGAQPAAPSAVICRWCDYATECSAFWGAVDESWAPEVRAATGIIRRVFTTPAGGTTFEIDRTGGSVSEQPMILKQVDAAAVPEVSRAAIGSEVAVKGLRPDERGGGYRLMQTGSFRVG